MQLLHLTNENFKIASFQLIKNLKYTVYIIKIFILSDSLKPLSFRTNIYPSIRRTGTLSFDFFSRGISDSTVGMTTLRGIRVMTGTTVDGQGIYRGEV